MAEEQVTITFIRDTRPTEKTGEPYFVGKTVTLPSASAEHWIKRGAAVVAPSKAKK